MQFTHEDHQRIAKAIGAAEAHTSGEIFCVIANQVSTYRDVSLGWAAAAALLLPLCLIPLGFDASWLPSLSHIASDGWQVAHAATETQTVSRALTAYALIQGLVFLTVYLLTLIPAVNRTVTPSRLRRRRVRRVALQQFMAHGLHQTEDRSGVLIFTALSDHQVEVIADKGIHEKVSPDIWAEAVAVLTRHLRDNQPVEGLEKAISICGTVLAEQFPPQPADKNELPDRLVII